MRPRHPLGTDRTTAALWWALFCSVGKAATRD